MLRRLGLATPCALLSLGHCVAIAGRMSTGAASAFVSPIGVGQPAQGIQSRHSSSSVVVAAASGSGDLERLRRIAQIKKLKETGGDYESFLENADKPKYQVKTGPVDYMVTDDDDVLSSKDYDDEDKELYEKLKKSEKAALMEKVKKYKEANPKATSNADMSPEERFKDVDTYEPQSVSWGLFARPKNIPEAFGGSQAVPLGGVKLTGDKEFDKKYEDLMALVREYSKEAAGLEYTPEEKLREDDIKIARREARSYMLRGEYENARDVLKPFRSMCSVKSALGTATLMDLAVAYEATYEFEEAQEIYKKVKMSPVADMRNKARALALGVEAMQKLDLGSRNRVNPKNVASFPYIPGMLEGSYGLYMKSSGNVELEERKAFSVKGTAEALDILEEAIIAQGVGVTSDMINAALRAIHGDLLANDEKMGPLRAGVGPSDVSRLDGRWRCRITSHTQSVDYTVKTDIWQRIDSAAMSVVGKLPVAPFESVRDVKSSISWDGRRSILDYGDAGFLQGKPSSLRVLCVRDSLMVTARCSGLDGRPPKEAFQAMFAVWTRAA